MNRPKSLLQYLDDKDEIERRKEREEKEKYEANNEVTDILLKYLLKSSEKEFYKKYDDAYLTGYSPIRPRLKPLIPVDEEEKNIIKEKVFIDASIDNLVDLIELCDQYPLADNVEYNINMKAIHNIKPTLKELQGMIGMKSIKENIIDQILYFVQDLHNVSPNDSDYMHTVIYGPPGTGKTEVAKIMGKIFSNLGMLRKNVFKKVTRDDLIAGYLGQTAIKTKDVIHECLGGVLFIDEAYALGNKEKKDSFSKESIDTICEALSDHKKDLMCIIAGYEDELKDCFFSFNPGLESRFTWKFNIDKYSPSEMKQIFQKKIKDNGWSLKEEIDDEWFDKNKEFFTYYGRDMETLFSKVKIAHSRRVFCLPKEEKTKITIKDLEKGFEIYKKMGNSEKRLEEIEQKKILYNSLYC